MISSLKLKETVSTDVVIEMRHAGMPMREIAEKIGRSKERVRQILEKGLGKTDHGLLSTLQLCNLSGLPRNRIIDLYMDGIIVPAAKWDAGSRDYLLWPPEAMSRIANYYKHHRLCKVCNQPLPKSRILFCSDKCRLESHKYKYMTSAEKKRVLENIRRYRERRKANADRPLSEVIK